MDQKYERGPVNLSARGQMLTDRLRDRGKELRRSSQGGGEDARHTFSGKMQRGDRKRSTPVNKFTRLGDLLVSVGAITEEQLQKGLELQKTSKKRLGSVLMESGIVTERQLIEALQLQLGIEFIDLTTTRIPPEMAQILPKNLAKKHSVVPVKVIRDELYLAMTDPLNFPAIEEVRTVTQKRVIPMIATQAAMERSIMNLYGNEGAARAIEEMRKEMGSEEDFGSMVAAGSQVGEEDANSAPTIRLVNAIIERAVVEKASDIHFEPREDQMVVRLRVDGVLHNALTVPQNVQGSVIARIKVMGGMDIAERRIPQDGRANVRIRQIDVDLRISTLPTIYGEKITIRLLNKSAGLLSMEGIGLQGRNLDKFRTLVKNNSSGVVLIVGPTGSGKSSSMYTMLNELNEESINIVSLEDPVEYNLDGINQVQINEKAGLTFASGLRSILRQDPDVIYVGEIRDLETAEIAMRAAITGHLVLSTLHTNSAISTIDRLIDLGVEPYLISAALRGVISQRLVRRICSSCRVEYEPTEEEQRKIGIPREEWGTHKFYRGAGCPDCFNSGYRGRVGVFEILTMTSEIEAAVRDGIDRTALAAAVEKSGFEPMPINCRELVLQGITTAAEAYKAVQSTDF